MEILSAMNDVNQDQEAVSGAQPVEVDAGELSRLQQLIIRPGEEGGILTQTEFIFSKFCAQEKLKKKTSDRLMSMIKRRDFVIEDIRAETIRELETLISDCSRSKISEYDLWTKADGKQEVKAYLRSLKHIVEDILADLGFQNLQYLWFEYREVNGERRYGPANGAIWWQITVRQIGKGHVLVAIIIFQDGSWVKMNLSCEPIYGELDCLIFVSCKMFTTAYRS
jgi:hypothetical protein